MSRKPTPAPGPTALQQGCFPIAALSGVVLVGIGISTGWVWPYLATLPSVLVISWLGYGKLLLLHFHLRHRRHGVCGVLITSDSPKWNDYIQANWIDRFGNRFIILNGSQQAQWSASPATRLYRFYCPYDNNYCPAIILLRGFRHPLVYRFFYAFRDYKHGDDTALLKLEQHLDHELNRL